MDVVAVLVLVAGLLLGPGPLAVVVAFLIVVAGRLFVTGG
jgi:hypothetical protein